MMHSFDQIALTATTEWHLDVGIVAVNWLTFENLSISVFAKGK